MTEVIAIGFPDAPVLAAIVIVAFVLMAALILAHASGRGPSNRLPRIRPRPLPCLDDQPPQKRTTNGQPAQLVVAGRTYEVTDGPDVSAEPCPWCLGSLDGVPPGEIVHCQQPYCGRAAHRKHNEENGGCGGVCSVAHA